MIKEFNSSYARNQYLGIDTHLSDAHTLLAQSILPQEAYAKISDSLLELKAQVSSAFAKIERETT